MNMELTMECPKRKAAAAKLLKMFGSTLGLYCEVSSTSSPYFFMYCGTVSYAAGCALHSTQHS